MKKKGKGKKEKNDLKTTEKRIFNAPPVVSTVIREKKYVLKVGGWGDYRNV